MSEHLDALEGLNEHLPLRDKLVAAHKSLSQIYPFIARIAVALYDSETTVLKTYLHSSGNGDPMEHYEARIDDAPSLKNLLENGHPRVINNLLTIDDNGHEHTARLGRHGYLAQRHHTPDIKALMQPRRGGHADIRQRHSVQRQRPQAHVVLFFKADTGGIGSGI